MRIIGLTGGIASGKSAVSAILQKYGGFIMDADKINHENMKKGNLAYIEIVELFGTIILDKTDEIDRSVLGELVFGDKKLLDALVAISHRHVIARTKEIIEEAEICGFLFGVIDAPLLIEANMQKMCRRVWLVFSDLELKISRLMLRNGFSREKALARINMQTPFDKQKKYADVVLTNNGSLLELENIVLSELENFLKQELL